MPDGRCFGDLVAVKVVAELSTVRNRMIGFMVGCVRCIRPKEKHGEQREGTYDVSVTAQLEQQKQRELRVEARFGVMIAQLESKNHHLALQIHKLNGFKLMKRLLRMSWGAALIFMAIPLSGQSIDEILGHMMARNEWQERALLEFRAQRKFYAQNIRFKTDATMYVQTVFHRPDRVQSTVTRHEGSKIIQSRVFDKILEAEAETSSKKDKQQVDIVPANYNFTLVATEDCDHRTCYHLKITPKQRNKYSLDGEIWVDAEDYSIVRIHGSPAKKPSMWTLKTEIDRRYKKVDGVWLPDRLDSSSNILIAGHSVLSIEYMYDSVQTSQ